MNVKRTIRVALGQPAIPYSADRESGLQPPLGMPAEQWVYRHARPRKPADHRASVAVAVTRSTDLRAARELADPKPPICSACGARLLPEWCNNVRPEDQADGYTYTDWTGTEDYWAQVRKGL